MSCEWQLSLGLEIVVLYAHVADQTGPISLSPRPFLRARYVGTGTKIFKLDAGSPSSGPTYLSELTLDAADGSGIFGLAVDPATGYGERD